MDRRIDRSKEDPTIYQRERERVSMRLSCYSLILVRSKSPKDKKNGTQGKKGNPKPACL